ncbi:hypothetical protein L5515_010373 [Caenorhabditis briggsae]|uniref:SEFIR domain-containing protein n=2 Tax=Caenorhabditis briggsae TaxID=6238 RepID=A0AAE9EQ18_CAEBR|nr:hypothetical protein L5515_010373 [Caenorhabditis briggsae]
MLFHSIFWLALFCLAGPQAVRTEPYNLTSVGSADVITSSDLLLLASEETPTRAPRPVTKQGAAKVTKVEKKKKNNEDEKEELKKNNGTEDVETVTPSEDPLWVTDCSEPLNKDISCSVNIIGCSDNVYKYVEPGLEPPRAHDVRVAPTTKVRGANKIDNRKHRLHVDVSWQMPQLERNTTLKAFKLIVNGPDGRNTCFVFNVTQTAKREDMSPRYRFSSNTLFEFGDTYTVTVVSLPISRKRAPKVSTTSLMPDDPDAALSTKLVKTHPATCTGKSNPQASKWAASFRKIFLFSAIRMIQIEFLAAPPQYCFEEYEVRLLDSSGIVMLQYAVISKEDLKTETINGKKVQFGEYNFTDIELDTNVIPSVIPIETSRDGRCLCETENGCSCLAADWKPVKLTKIEKPPMQTNETVEMDDMAQKDRTDPGTWHWHTYALTGVILLVIVFVLLICSGPKCYRRFRKTKKAGNVHLMNENPAFSHSGSIPLILKQSVSVLILYSHDSAQHEAAVLAFAELLRDVFHLNVHLDAWDEDDIEENRAEYINASIVRADKVILINSIGAYYRTIFRHKMEPALERVVRGRNDGIFQLQCELALQHPCVISCHFNYTNPKYILFPVTRLLQYAIPDNLMTMTTSLTGQPARPEQLAGFNQSFARLQAAVSRKAHYIESDPQWFENTHHRVAPNPVIPEEEKPVIEVVPLPPSLRLATEYENMETMAMDDLEKKLEKSQEPSDVTVEIEEDHNITLDYGPRKSDLLRYMEPSSANDVTIDLEEEEDDVDSMEDSSPTARIEELQRLIVSTDKGHDSGNLDSAYVSGSDFSTDIHTDILDKPRLSPEKDRRKAAREDSAFHDDVIGVH